MVSSKAFCSLVSGCQPFSPARYLPVSSSADGSLFPVLFLFLVRISQVIVSSYLAGRQFPDSSLWFSSALITAAKTGKPAAFLSTSYNIQYLQSPVKSNHTVQLFTTVCQRQKNVMKQIAL